jgi:two-component system sensor histidine kinase GlrK
MFYLAANNYWAGTSQERNELLEKVDCLISNAVKFSPTRRVIDITADITPDNLTIDVADQRPGIDAADESRIFEPFYRGKRSVAQRISGAGVGLAIARACVELHYGEIGLTITTATGATFRLSLPLRPS